MWFGLEGEGCLNCRRKSGVEVGDVQCYNHKIESCLTVARHHGAHDKFFAAKCTRGRGEVLGQAGVAGAYAYTLEGVSKSQKKQDNY